ncbi:Mal regulon transcriptional regulator MalI [Enterobacteriaceae bacterium LUAb1]
MKKITIHDVAERADVSVTTVSLVLSGKGRISAETIQRVNQAIETLGYIRNRPAASLRRGESGIIGVIIRDLNDPFYAAVTSGLSDTLEKQGKMLFLTQSGQNEQHLHRCITSLLAQGGEGIVLAGGSALTTPLIQQLSTRGVPLISVSQAGTSEHMDSVRPDNVQAAHMATEFLIQRGYHTIAWLGGESSSLTRAERIGGYCSALMQYGLPFRREWIVECGNNPQQASDLMGQLIHQYPTITAILCHSSAVALGGYLGLMRTGHTPGKDAIESYYERKIALVGFDDVPAARFTDSFLTVVDSPAQKMGEVAAERLLQRLQEPTGLPQSIIVPPVLIVRGSA